VVDWRGKYNLLVTRGRTAMLSARNQLVATIKSVKLGNVMAEVVMSLVLSISGQSLLERQENGAIPKP
jgi:hypothetical protein